MMLLRELGKFINMEEYCVKKLLNLGKSTTLILIPRTWMRELEIEEGGRVSMKIIDDRIEIRKSL